MSFSSGAGVSFGSDADSTPGSRLAAAARQWLARLDALPPVRLPLGPPLPWRVALPLLVVAAAAWGVLVLRPGAPAEAGPGLHAAPTQEPLFAADPRAGVAADPRAGVAADPRAGVAAGSGTGVALDPRVSAAALPRDGALGAPEPPGLGVDLVDLGAKLLIVLALAYGSLALLRRLGVGGAVPARAGLPPTETLRVLSTLSLAPNRQLHVVRAPGGKMLLLGSTPGQVTFLADLGDAPAAAAASPSGSFLDLLNGSLAGS